MQLDDYDVMIQNIMDWGLENPVIFNCQLGIGRTTTGESQQGRLGQQGCKAATHVVAQECKAYA